MEVHTAADADKARVRAALQAALGDAPDVVAAYLHGSFLRGPFRDVDVAVLLDGEPDPEACLRREIDLEARLDPLVDFPLDVRALNHAPLPFRAAAVGAGERLVARDADRAAAFEARTWSLYHDLKPHLEAHRRTALGLGP